MVVERAPAGLGIGVKQAALAARCHRHPHRGGQPLPERPGGDLDAPGVPVLRVPWGLRAPGPQRLQVLDFQPVSGQVELDVEGQAAVAARQHEPVPAKPLDIGRVMDEHVLEQQIRQRGQAHRRSRVPVADLLDRVGRQQPDGVGRADVDILPAGQFGFRPGQRRVTVLQAGMWRGRGIAAGGVLLVHRYLVHSYRVGSLVSWCGVLS